MKLFLKIVLPLFVLMVLFLIFTFYQLKLPGEVTQQQGEGQKEKPVPKATGNIDDAIDAISAFSDNENLLLDQEDSEASLVQNDKENINSYLTTYDENEF